MNSLMKSKEVLSVSYTEDVSCLAVRVVPDGDNDACFNNLREDDEYGNSPYLREWITDNNPEALPYIAPEPIPEEISRRQFFQQLSDMEIISRAEPLAAFQAGVISTPLLEIINILPTEDDIFKAKMLAAGAQDFNRMHPLAEIVRQALHLANTVMKLNILLDTPLNELLNS